MGLTRARVATVIVAAPLPPDSLDVVRVPSVWRRGVCHHRVLAMLTVVWLRVVCARTLDARLTWCADDPTANTTARRPHARCCDNPHSCTLLTRRLGGRPAALLGCAPGGCLDAHLACTHSWRLCPGLGMNRVGWVHPAGARLRWAAAATLRANCGCPALDGREGVAGRVSGEPNSVSSLGGA